MRITDKCKAMRNRVKDFCRCSFWRDPGFSKHVNIVSVDQVSLSSIMKRMSKRHDVESAYIENRIRDRSRIRLDISR